MSIFSNAWKEGHSAALRGDDLGESNSFSGEDRFEFAIGYDCGKHDLRQRLARFRATLPTLDDCGKALGIPVESWKGRCYEIASQLVSRGLIPGRAVYGAYEGPVASSSMFANKATFGISINHGWIISEDGTMLIDPTRWVFLDVAPSLFVTMKFWGDEYDEGANRRRAKFRFPFPPPSPNARFEPPPPVRALLVRMGHGERERLGLREMAWLANASPDDLGAAQTPLYDWLVSLGQDALIPIDNRAACAAATN